MSNRTSSILSKEALFQTVLHVVVFIFYASSRRHPEIELHEVVFFAQLAIVTFIINYVFLPKLLYRKKYLYFAIATILLISAAVLMEEFVLERLFFPKTRGSHFAGLYALMGILPVVTILTGFKFGWDAFKKQAEVDTLKEHIKDSELQFLKSQINPHFLFNNLNNIYAHAIENSPRTPDIILELSDALRYMLYDCKADYVALDQELAHLESFIKLQELQIENRGKITFEKSGPFDQFQIAPLILIVFIENAFKHSSSSQSDDIEIDISVKVDSSGQLRLTCQNTYGEFSNTKSISGGIGLANVKKRLQMLYPNSHELSITKKDAYFDVVLDMTVQRKHT